MGDCTRNCTPRRKLHPDNLQIKRKKGAVEGAVVRVQFFEGAVYSPLPLKLYTLVLHYN